MKNCDSRQYFGEMNQRTRCVYR